MLGKKLFVVGLALVLALPAMGVVVGQGDTPELEVGVVVDVIDGDTIDVRVGDDAAGAVYTVRYIGVNTPERDETCYQDAADANAELVEGQTVYLRRDQSNTDRYGRLLRYVYAGGTFVNAQLVIDGWAEAVEYPPDTAFAPWFEFLEAEAVAAGLGCHLSGVFGGGAAQAQPDQSGVTITASSSVNLRSGPGTNYPEVGTLQAGQTVQATDRNGDWLYLGNGQWVAAWVVAIEGDVNALPTRSAPAAPQQSPPQQAQAQPVQATATAAPAQPVEQEQPAQPAQQPVEQALQSTPPPAPAFTCDPGKTCGAMASCEEAYFQLSQCGATARDSDGDGVPCESICPGG